MFGWKGACGRLGGRVRAGCVRKRAKPASRLMLALLLTPLRQECLDYESA